MASVKVSALVTGFKGKLRGSVLQFTAAGQVIRANKNYNRHGRVSFQNAKVNTQTTLIQWKSLTPTQRASWASAAPNFPTTTRFGDPRTPAAYQLFMRLNNPLNYHLATFNSTAPSPWSFSNIASFTVTYAGTPAALKITLGANYVSGERLLIRATAPLSPGRNNPGQKYVTLAVYNTPGTLVYDVTAAYTSMFGYIPVGMKAYFKVQLLSVSSGQLSTPYIGYVIF